jgi:rubrerythrin
MSQSDSIEAILDFAIDNEIEAYQFYTDLAAKVDNPAMKQVFLEFAAEEQGHRKLLEDAKRGKKINTGDENIADLKIADYAIDCHPTPDMDYQAALILAMKKEKASFALYFDLSAAAKGPTAKTLLQFLAQQEAKHKLRFELEYDEVILKDN